MPPTQQIDLIVVGERAFYSVIECFRENIGLAFSSGIKFLTCILPDATRTGLHHVCSMKRFGPVQACVTKCISNCLGAILSSVFAWNGIVSVFGVAARKQHGRDRSPWHRLQP